MTYKEAMESFRRSANLSKLGNTAAAIAAANKTTAAIAAANNTGMTPSNRSVEKRASPQLPGTIFRISVPSGTALNFLNLVEMSSPGGMSFNIRLPFLSGLTTGGFRNPTLLGIMDAIKAAGGTIEVVN